MSDAAIMRGWLDRLGLSDAEGADALNFSDVTAIRKIKAGKSIGGPTLRLMLTLERVADALVALQFGQTEDARQHLHFLLKGPMQKHVRNRVRADPRVRGTYIIEKPEPIFTTR